MSPGAGDGLCPGRAPSGFTLRTLPPRPLTGLAAFNVHPTSTSVLRLGFAFGPSRRQAIPPVVRPLLTSPRRAAPSRTPPSRPTRRSALTHRSGIPGHPWRPPRIRPATFLAHPPRLRDGPLMTTGFAVPSWLAQTAPPPTRRTVRVPRVAISPPASSPPRLTTTQLPSACGWCHLLHGGLAPPSCWSCRAYSGRRGEFHPPAPSSGRDGLPSPGSCRLGHQGVAFHAQWAKRPGCWRVMRCQPGEGLLGRPQPSYFLRIQRIR